MEIEFKRLACCGVFELHRLCYFDTPQSAFLAYVDKTYLRKEKRMQLDNTIADVAYPFDHFRYVIFTQAKKMEHYGKAFAAFIEKHALGSVIHTTFNKNPNSGNFVKVWVWTVDHDACQRLLTKLGKQVPTQ